jgi:hypothetical protein
MSSVCPLPSVTYSQSLQLKYQQWGLSLYFPFLIYSFVCCKDGGMILTVECQMEPKSYQDLGVSWAPMKIHISADSNLTQAYRSSAVFTMFHQKGLGSNFMNGLRHLVLSTDMSSSAPPTSGYPLMISPKIC